MSPLCSEALRRVLARSTYGTKRALCGVKQRTPDHCQAVGTGNFLVFMLRFYIFFEKSPEAQSSRSWKELRLSQTGLPQGPELAAILSPP